MRHQKSVSRRLLALLLCLGMVVQLSATALAAESGEPEEGMLSSEAVQMEEAPEAEDTAEVAVQEAEASEAEAPAEESKPQEKKEEQEPDVDSPEFWSKFREQYAEDGDYLKRYESYQSEGVMRAFEDDDDVPGTIEAMSDEELEVMASNNGTTKSPFTGKTYTHAASKKGMTVTLGIDVSKWQDSVDWYKVKAAGVKYVILRCGYTRVHSFNMNKDERFDKFIKEAHDAGLKIGIYYFSQATTVSEAEKEAKKTLEQIKPYKDLITLPVFMDIETGKMSGKAYRINKVSRTQGTKNVLAYCKIIEDAGYKAYYYGNPNDLANMCDVSLLGDYGCWLARYATSTTYSGAYDFWQYTSVGKVKGISGGVDCNFWYTGKSTAEEEESAKPAQVTGLAVTEAGDTYVDLKWNVISNAESYTVEGKTDGGSYQTLMTFTGDFSKGNTCRVTGLTPGATYTIRVKAVNRKGTGSASATVSVTTLAPVEEEAPMFRGQIGDTSEPEQSGDISTPTDVPTSTDIEEPEEDQHGLAAPKKVTVKVTDEGDQVSWTAVDNAKHYRVFLKSSSDENWVAYADTDELSILIPDAENNCQYAVRPVNKMTSLEEKNYAGNSYTAVYRLATPKITSVENNGKQVKVKWKKVSGAKKYIVFFRYFSDEKWTRKKTAGITESVTITQKGSKGDQLLYTVRCVTDDEEGYCSDYVDKGVMALRAPKVTSVKNSKKGTLDAEWNGDVWSDSKGVGYEVRCVLSGKETKKSLKGWSKTKNSFTKLTKGKTYAISVRSWRQCKVDGKTQKFYSAWSSAKKVKVSK